MQNLRNELLEWGTGIFCLMVGSMMLVVPHQFDTPSYGLLKSALSLWGVLFFLAGGSLLAVAVFKPRRLLVVSAHFFTGILLLLLAGGFAQVGALSGITHYTVLALGTLISPFVTNRNTNAPRTDDFFIVVMSVAAVVTGASILLFPDQYNATIIATVRGLLPGMGIGFLVAGLFALIVVGYSRVLITVYSVALVLLGLVYLLWFVQMAMPIRALTGYPYYGGMGLLLVLSPWLQEHVHRLQHDSLRIRFTLVLAFLTVVPLLILAFLFTEQQSRASIDQALNNQRNFAAAQASYVASLVTQYRSTADAFAATPGLLEMTPEEQERLVKTLKQAHPDANLFSIRDASNNLIVRSDGIRDVPRQPLSDEMFAEMRSTNQPTMRVAKGLVYDRLFFIFGSPIRNEDGNFAGYVVVSVDSNQINTLLNPINANTTTVYMVDEQGHAIVHPDENVVQTSADLSHLASVAAFLASNDPSDSMSYTASDGNTMLAGFARVPNLSWGVVIEQTEKSVLTGVQSGRELSLLMLILVCSTALLVGIVLSRTLTAPLWKVASAMNQLAAGGDQALLLPSGTAEVNLLINAVNNLHKRLKERTEERDKAEKRLIFLAEATNLLNTSLDVKEILRAIARLAVPTMGDWCTIDVLDENNVLQQIAVVHSDPETEALVTAWRAKALQEPHDVDLGRDVLRSGEPVLIPEIPENMIQAVATDDEDTLKLLKALNLLSALCVPLTVRGERIGIIFLNTARESGRRLSNDDVVLLTELARRASTAIDNAQLYQDAQQEISRRQQVERALRQSEDQLRLITDALPVLISYVDAEGRYQFNNRAYEEWFGHRRDEITGKHMREVLGESAYAAIESYVKDVLSGKTTHYEMVIPYQDAGEKYVAASYIPHIDTDGDVRGFIVLVNDITDRNRREQERQHLLEREQAALAEAQQAIQIRDEFLSVAAHELKTPVTSLRGFAQMSLRQLAKTQALDPAQVERSLKTIDQQSIKLSRLINQLLDVSRLHTGRLTLDLQQTDIGALVQAVVSNTHVDPAKYPIIVNNHTSITATIDSLRLEQVVTNLVDNAIKYSPDGGPITIEIASPDVSTFSIAVQDRGLGIPEEHRPFLFGRFYQAHAQHHLGGLGLGLYISRQIIEQHGGSIHAEYPAEGGTRIVVTLPIQPISQNSKECGFP